MVSSLQQLGDMQQHSVIGLMHLVTLAPAGSPLWRQMGNRNELLLEIQQMPLVNRNNKKTPEGVYAGWIGWSKNYVERRACLIKTRNGEMIKWENGETVLLKVRAKVVRYNPSNKIIECINKRTQQSRFLFQFVLVTLHICAALQKFTLYLFDTNIQRHSVSVQSTCLPIIMYKIHREVGSILIIHFMRLLKLRA